MVKFYVKRILDGKMEVTEVPPKWIDAVKLELKERNK